jgi:hypothetical protein
MGAGNSRLSRYRMVSFGVILFVANFAYGGLCTGQSTITTGKGLDFSSLTRAVVKTSNWFDSLCGYNTSVSGCKNPAFDSVDITYFMTPLVWDGFDCCGGRGTGFRSFDTVWRIKNIATIDFGKPLSIYDTVHFSAVDHKTGCPAWVATTYAGMDDCLNCYRPEDLPKYYFLTKTHLKKYLLFRVVSQKSCNFCSPNKNYDYTAQIAWYLQPDGSLNFKDYTTSIAQNASAENKKALLSMTGKTGFVWPGMKIQAGAKLFDCRGRAIKNSPGRFAHCSQLLIQLFR